MNKVILTNDRIFMSVVGPSGCGKTDLIFKMLKSSTFYPRFTKILYFYREYQPLFSKIQREIAGLEFVKYSGFEITKTLSDCLLIYDDSCEEVFNEPEFVKLATSGRHRRINILYVKHNLFHQSKHSRTIDLNTTHIVLFKSLRDIQQIEYLGKQLNALNVIKEAYETATKEPYGHLVIDLDPKTTEGLRFCSNVIGPSPSIFYLPTQKARVTSIADEKEARAYTAALVQS